MRGHLFVTSVLLAALVACGGRGGGSTTISTPAPAPVILSGVTATGAAFADAVVTVIDSTGAAVGTSSPVGADGIFSVTLSTGAKPPFALVASRTTADGQVQSLVSVLESTSATVANITPITNLIASRLSPSGDPLKLSTELAYIGEQSSWHDDREKFFFDPAFIDELCGLQAGPLKVPQNYLTIIAKGDEVLDWREMSRRYTGTRLCLLENGDHALSDFDEHLSVILDFLDLEA